MGQLSELENRLILKNGFDMFGSCQRADSIGWGFNYDVAQRAHIVTQSPTVMAFQNSVDRRQRSTGGLTNVAHDSWALLPNRLGR
ncbi:MAG TPA: hypothetical protein VN937_27540 [Blastocatellia bacterium]|nr:hypothetical protein [Blastocatellia bacterium]